ncbi:hypothetical protein GCM10009802_36380 [Streptomyces synnematoformans]|uniref:Uncharacterized protein n=1 Tax=Streptomyces synnematoformans TaxID=415721 RepID=A0ABP5K8H1_9ACTN
MTTSAMPDASDASITARALAARGGDPDALDHVVRALHRDVRRGVVQPAHRRGAGPVDAGPHGAHRAVAQQRRLGVRQADQLRQHERLPPLGRQRGQQLGEGHRLVGSRQAARLGPLRRGLPVVRVGQPRAGGGPAPAAPARPPSPPGDPVAGRRHCPASPVCAMPRTICRWKIAKTTSSGSPPMTTDAIICA